MRNNLKNLRFIHKEKIIKERDEEIYIVYQFEDNKFFDCITPKNNTHIHISNSSHKESRPQDYKTFILIKLVIFISNIGLIYDLLIHSFSQILIRK